MKLSKSYMNYTITLEKGKEFKAFGGKEKTTVTIDHKGHGVNGDYTREKVMPILLKKMGYEGASFKLEGFRYYLGTYIEKLTIYTQGQELTGHIVSSWLDNELITID